MYVFVFQHRCINRKLKITINVVTVIQSKSLFSNGKNNFNAEAVVFLRAYLLKRTSSTYVNIR